MAHDEGQVTTFFQSAVDKGQCHIESKKLFQGNGDSHAHREGGVGTEEVIHFSRGNSALFVCDCFSDFSVST